MWSRWPTGWGLKCVCGGPLLKKTGQFTSASPVPSCHWQNWSQAPRHLDSGLDTVRSRPPPPRPGCSPVGAGAWQRAVAASCPRGTAGIIADAQDPELVAGLATWVESPAGPQREVVAPLGEVSRDRGVLHLLWGHELLGG